MCRNFPLPGLLHLRQQNHGKQGKQLDEVPRLWVSTKPGDMYKTRPGPSFHQVYSVHVVKKTHVLAHMEHSTSHVCESFDIVVHMKS